MDKRPFLDYWDQLWKLELQRQKGAFDGSGIVMIKTFIADIGTQPFLYLEEEEDIQRLYVQMSQNYFHQEAFVYGIYFAAWIKSEVNESKQIFKKHDEGITGMIEQGGSIQCMLIDLVRDTIQWETFLEPFKTNINGVKKFLDVKGVFKSDDFAKLDDIEARHLMDQIVMYSGLDEMRLHEIQSRLGQSPQTTDQRSKFGFTPSCIPED